MFQQSYFLKYDFAKIPSTFCLENASHGFTSKFNKFFELELVKKSYGNEI